MHHFITNFIKLIYFLIKSLNIVWTPPHSNKISFHFRLTFDLLHIVFCVQYLLLQNLSFHIFQISKIVNKYLPNNTL